MSEYNPGRNPFPGVSQETIAKLLDYNPHTGLFVWRQRDPEDFSPNNSCDRTAFCKYWNEAHAGKPAFDYVGSTGYKTGKLLGKQINAHRVAWFITYGVWPSIIDHINRVRTDNRIVNLRDTTRLVNVRNRAVCINTGDSNVGVRHMPKPDTWEAYIRIGEILIQLGTYDTKAEAIAARRAAECVRDKITPTNALASTQACVSVLHST